MALPVHIQCGNLFGSKYRYEGEGYGVGISIGRAYQLGRRWNLEWEIGPGQCGWDMTNTCANVAVTLWKRTTAGIFLPTRAALNMVYLF